MPYWRIVLLYGVFFFWLFASLIGYAIATNEEREAIRQAALAQAEEAKWTLLRSQLSPHLVLNVLNGLAGLAEEDGEKAAKGLEDLAEVYQQINRLGDLPRISLGEERALLVRYLEVEKLRLEKLLTLEWDWDDTLDTFQVLPLLLQPLVENAIKHGIGGSVKGGTLVIGARREGDEVILEVKNTGGKLGKEPSYLMVSSEEGGVGVRNLTSRLALAYKDKATFTLSEVDDWTCARIGLPA